MVVAIAQIYCQDGDFAGNLQRIELAIQSAKTQGAALVLFPESVLYGWLNPEAHEKASPIPGPDSDLLCQMAKKHQIYLCIGLDEKDGDQLFGSAILIDDQGVLLAKHRKINVLPELMSPPYTPGNAVTCVQTRFGKIGLLVCADSFQRENLVAMQQMQPDLLLIPYGWAAPEAAWPAHGLALQKVVQHAAQVAGCPVVGADLVGILTNGPWKGQVYGGQSVACDKKGAIIALGKDREPDLLVFTVSVEPDF
jgi:predicted amidohydrolase